MWQGQSEDLVRTQARVAPAAGRADLALGTIDDIVKIAAGIEPECLFEVRTNSRGARGIVCRIRGASEIGREIPHDGNRVEPERVDLDRLADARSDHPVADLGVHPGQLHALPGPPAATRRSGSTWMPKRVPRVCQSSMSLSVG